MAYRDIHAPVFVFSLVFLFSDVGIPMKLTDTKVRNAKIGKSPVSLSDAGGLYLHITPAGGKLWRYNYRFGGKQKTITFGRYPEISLRLTCCTVPTPFRLLSMMFTVPVRGPSARGSNSTPRPHASPLLYWCNSWLRHSLGKQQVSVSRLDDERLR
jgi:hypothetical protein